MTNSVFRDTFVIHPSSTTTPPSPPPPSPPPSSPPPTSTPPSPPPPSSKVLQSVLHLTFQYNLAPFPTVSGIFSRFLSPLYLSPLQTLLSILYVLLSCFFPSSFASYCVLVCACPCHLILRTAPTLTPNLVHFVRLKHHS